MATLRYKVQGWVSVEINGPNLVQEVLEKLKQGNSGVQIVNGFANEENVIYLGLDNVRQIRTEDNNGNSTIELYDDRGVKFENANDKTKDILY